MKKIFILIGVLLIISGLKTKKSFPKINLKKINGKIITNEYFSQSETIVIHFHLGCPPAMILLNDLEKLSASEIKNFQFLFILENTEKQVEDFYAEEDNTWSKIRKAYKLHPTNFDIIAECSKDKTKTKNGNIIITSQCIKFSKKLKIKSSPTIFKINQKGKIDKKQKGYFYKSNIEWLSAFLED